jgi:catechol 2,3-dioxygenase-like lactoylglutathione lyase family enzyme
MEARVLGASHLIVYVADTDATIAFWCKGLGARLEQDEELAAPALDALFGRVGVRIRDTFIAIGGLRLHTIQPLDVPSDHPPRAPRAPGISGLSLEVSDIEAARARVAAEGLRPTPIYDFDAVAVPCRMFFLDDPDGIRVEMIQYLALS